VCARNRRHVDEKIIELKKMKMPFVIVCGEKNNLPDVVYRANNGKWDAINFGSSFVPKKANIIVLNDVDTKIYDFEHAVEYLKEFSIVYCKVCVFRGGQIKFYKILDPLRKIFHIAASGELMLIKREAFERALPLEPCIAEDSYMLFKILEFGYKAQFCTKTYVTTERTINARGEEAYKYRTTLGIYQALNKTKPPPFIRIFYLLLPFFAPLLYLAGKDGKAWTKGINRAFKDHITKKNPTKF
jgi:hypothetical protein